MPDFYLMMGIFRLLFWKQNSKIYPEVKSTLFPIVDTVWRNSVYTSPSFIVVGVLGWLLDASEAQFVKSFIFTYFLVVFSLFSA